MLQTATRNVLLLVVQWRLRVLLLLLSLLNLESEKRSAVLDSNGENGVQFLFGLHFHGLFRLTIGIKVVLV